MGGMVLLGNYSPEKYCLIEGKEVEVVALGGIALLIQGVEV